MLQVSKTCHLYNILRNQKEIDIHFTLI